MFGFDLLDWIVSESIRTNEQTGCASAGTNDDIREGRVRDEGKDGRSAAAREEGWSKRKSQRPKTVFLDLAPMLAVPVVLLRYTQLHLHSMCY